MKTFFKKYKIFHYTFEVFISFSEYIFLQISIISKLLLRIRIFRRLAFNLQPRNKNILLNTNYGLFIINTNSRIIGKKSYIENSPYSLNSVKKVLEILNNEHILIEYFVDLGSNIGTTSISAAFINKKINFLCIEGNKENFNLLQKNVEINDLINRFQLHNDLVGNSNIERIFVEFKEEKGCSRVFKDFEELDKFKKIFKYEVDSIKKVKTKKIEDILNINFDENIFFWIDLEGLDLEVLDGVITKNRHPIFFEFNPSFYSLKLEDHQNYFQKFEVRLMKYGYEYYFVEAKNFKKEKIKKGFLTEIEDLVGLNKSATNILLI